MKVRSAEFEHVSWREGECEVQDTRGQKTID